MQAPCLCVAVTQQMSWPLLGRATRLAARSGRFHCPVEGIGSRGLSSLGFVEDATSRVLGLGRAGPSEDGTPVQDGGPRVCVLRPLSVHGRLDRAGEARGQAWGSGPVPFKG